jgi:hypothetical protein
VKPAALQRVVFFIHKQLPRETGGNLRQTDPVLHLRNEPRFFWSCKNAHGQGGLRAS